jgi:hypothetical protein
MLSAEVIGDGLASEDHADSPSDWAMVLESGVEIAFSWQSQT